MSGKTIQRTLTNAFGVIGRVLGWDFKVYRPLDWVVPMADANYVGSIKLSATPDDSYTAKPDELDKFMLYTKSSVELGDILYSEDLSRTYVVFEKTELRAAIGVLCQDEFTLLRAVHTVGADKPMGFEELGIGIPAAVKFVGAAGTDGAMAITKGTLSAASSQIELWTWLPAEFVKLNDVVQIGANRYLVTFAQTTAKGTKLKATSTKVGK